MKLNHYVLTLLIVLWPNMTINAQTSCNSFTEFDKEAAHNFVCEFMSHYPLATLQDIYKGAFQDYYGPAHILTERSAVERYIRTEIEQMHKELPSCHRQYFEQCSWRGNFYRVDLSVITDGKVNMNDFVNAFIESANAIDTTLTSSWISEWNEMIDVVRNVAPNLEGYKTDSAAIANMLSEGKYVMHHSVKFNNAYRPHYRIIRKDIFRKRILPCLL